MIVERKYEWLGLLYQNDEQSRSAIDKAFLEENVDEDKKRELLDYNYFNIPEFLNLGCGIPWESYKRFMKDFERLDIVSPYDNGLTFKDISDIEYETSRKGTAMQMRFIIRTLDIPYRIVGFVAIENIKGTININEGWDMIPPFTIG